METKKKNFKNLKKTKWQVKSSLKAIVSFNGESRITDNVINLLWVMASWKSKWNLTWRRKIESIDCILPVGFRDWVPKELQRVGCVELLNTVQRRVRPKLHVFGGIHEGKTRRKEFTRCWAIIHDLIPEWGPWLTWEWPEQWLSNFLPVVEPFLEMKY